VDTSETYINMFNVARYHHWDDFKNFDITKDRQDQLQEMVIDKGESRRDELWRITCDFEAFVLAYCIIGRGDYRLRDFTSMEQLWLAFVMKEKYQKVWDGNGWIKE